MTTFLKNAKPTTANSNNIFGGEMSQKGFHNVPEPGSTNINIAKRTGTASVNKFGRPLTAAMTLENAAAGINRP